LELGNPRSVFYPAKVIEARVPENRNGVEVERKLQMTFSSCVQVRTSVMMDPDQNSTWVPPQGGEGPVHTNC
jgi:electron-transferring-flavoprotein dehydrogenase